MIRVLIADDQPLIRAGIRGVLDLEDDLLVVGEVADGQAAVRGAHGERADIVLMDIRMPGLDGIEATRRIRADENLAGVRIIILTTFETDDNVAAALHAGASGFLGKGPVRTRSSTRSGSWPTGRRCCRRGRPGR